MWVHSRSESRPSMSSARSTGPRWTRLLAGVAASTMILTATIGCSTSDGATTSGSGEDLTASQQQCLDKANNFLETRGLLPESLPPELTPLSKTPTQGMTITRLYPGSVPSSGAVAQRIVEIAPEIGWTGKKLAYDGSVEDLNRKLLSAIADSDIVEVDGADPASVQGAIAAAKEKGVLLMLGAIIEPPESVPGFGGVPNGGELFNQMGELAAYGLMQATNCRGNVAAFGIPFGAMRTLAQSMGDVVERECPDCNYSYSDIPSSDIGSPAATNAIVSKLQSDPSINFTFVTIGDLALGLRPALKQAGLDAQIGGALPTPRNLSELKKGDNTFWLGAANEITAWCQVDTAARALDSGKPTTGLVPVPLFTADNLESTDPVPAYPTDYAEQFKSLWKVN